MSALCGLRSFRCLETDKYVILGERILLTLQGIDISPERIAEFKANAIRAPIE